MKRFVFAAAIGLLTVACGAYSFGPAASPTPTPVAGVTDRDHVATIHVGQKLEVALHAGSNMSNWTHPKSSDESVLAPTVDPAATAAIGVTLAMFIGVKRGTANVTATSAPKCPPNAACPMYLAVYSLKVTVAT